MSFLDNLARSVEKTANSLGHQAGQFIDGHASGGFLTYFSTGNIVVLVCRLTGKALQIVASKDGCLLVDGLGAEHPEAFNTRWTVINEGNNIIRLHNNNNYLCINNSRIGLIHLSGTPIGAESRLRIAQIGDYGITLESVKEPGHYLSVDQCGNATHCSQAGYTKHFYPKLLSSPYGPVPVQQHSYHL